MKAAHEKNHSHGSTKGSQHCHSKVCGKKRIFCGLLTMPRAEGTALDLLLKELCRPVVAGCLPTQWCRSQIHICAKAYCKAATRVSILSWVLKGVQQFEHNTQKLLQNRACWLYKPSCFGFVCKIDVLYNGVQKNYVVPQFWGPGIYWCLFFDRDRSHA